MPIPTEPIGSIPRPPTLQQAVVAGDPLSPDLDPCEWAVVDTSAEFEATVQHANNPVKQAVISPSALSLMYPPGDLPGYPRDQFISDLLREHESEVRRCLEAGAYKVLGRAS